jgi:acid phosphatase
LERLARPAWCAIPCLLASLALARPAAPAANGVPILNHVILVVMENHSYDQVRTLPYISTPDPETPRRSRSRTRCRILRAELPRAVGCEHARDHERQLPAARVAISASNLGSACEVAGVSWKSYCENLPSVGSTVCSSTDNLYRRKHHACPDFSNLNHARECPYSQLAADIAAGTLPGFAFVARTCATTCTTAPPAPGTRGSRTTCRR